MSLKRVLERATARLLPSVSKRMRRSRILEALCLNQPSQVMVDGQGKLYPLATILDSLLDHFQNNTPQTPNLFRERSQFKALGLWDNRHSTTVNIAIGRLCGQSVPFTLFEHDGTKLGIQHGIGQIDVHLGLHTRTAINFDGDEMQTPESALHQHLASYQKTSVKELTNLMVNNLLIPWTRYIRLPVSERPEGIHRNLVELEHWHETMRLLIENEFALDPVASLAPNVGRNYQYNAQTMDFSMLNAGRRMTLYAGDDGLAPPSAAILPNVMVGESHVGDLIVDTQNRSRGVLMHWRPGEPFLLVTADALYTDAPIPRTMEATMAGEPLSSLISHPLLDDLGFTIVSVDHKPSMPKSPNKAERQAMMRLWDKSLVREGPQPNLDPWFNVPTQFANPNSPVTRITLTGGRDRIIRKQDLMMEDI